MPSHSRPSRCCGNYATRWLASTTISPQFPALVLTCPRALVLDQNKACLMPIRKGWREKVLSRCSTISLPVATLAQRSLLVVKLSITLRRVRNTYCGLASTAPDRWRICLPRVFTAKTAMASRCGPPTPLKWTSGSQHIQTAPVSCSTTAFPIARRGRFGKNQPYRQRAVQTMITTK